MIVRISRLPTNPNLGFDAVEVAKQAPARLQSFSPAPGTLSCPGEADIPRIMRLAGQSACEGLQLTRWFWDQERVERAQISDATTDSYS